MKNIYKSFNGVEVLHDVKFDVVKGECIAICGENGAGKSTLMKILAGIHDFEGEIVFKGREIKHNSPMEAQNVGISMIHQELNLLEDMTIAQNIFLCREPKKNGLIDYKKMEKDAKDILQQLEYIDPKMKVKELGIAKKQIVEIAKALSYNADLIIMDEPTAVLTIKESEMLFDLIRQLKNKGVSVIYISHRLKEIMDICDRITVLRDGDFIATKRIEEVTEKEIAELMVGRKIEKMSRDMYSGTGEKVLEVENISDDFLKDISFYLRKGEILGVFGLIGAGRSEVAECIFGLRKTQIGQIKLNGKQVAIRNPRDAIKMKIGFATEDRKGSGLFLEQDIGENSNVIKRLITKGAFLQKKNENVLANRMVDMFKIKCSNTYQKVKNLSGGNQQKVVLSKWVAVDSEILILDEPTRGVDVGARKEIYEVINKLAVNGKSILMISSDLTEILSVSHRVLIMHEGTIRGEMDKADISEKNAMVLATGID